ncbi:hypothetical protein TRIATDRAFT_160745, partial [Trichoderma atroviride IMI 206040]
MALVVKLWFCIQRASRSRYAAVPIERTPYTCNRRYDGTSSCGHGVLKQHHHFFTMLVLAAPPQQRVWLVLALREKRPVEDQSGSSQRRLVI